jgi:acetolactate synthase-1/2/3 large subunit
MTRKSVDGTVADAYLALLADRGIDYFFGNAGTDFAPIIEAFAKAAALGTPTPKPMLVPHENLAIHMALGYYAVSGRPQVVMVHVNVGTANALNGLINAAKGNLPVLFTSGRTPYTEYGNLAGQRTREVHWPQEMRDQGALAREVVKWDYELRNAETLETVVDRALNIAMSEPRGPIYLTLPREPLATGIEGFAYDSPSRHATPTVPYPDPVAIDQAAAMLAKAENPLIITATLGTDPSVVPGFAALVDRFAIPVVQRKARCLCLPSDHPMHLGYDSDPHLETADVIVVAGCDVPWIPAVKAPGPDCRVIHLGPDPIYGTYPVRGYTADLAITGSFSATIPALAEALAAHEGTARPRIDSRRKRIAGHWQTLRDGWRAALERAKGAGSIHPLWISHCIEQVRSEDDIVVIESPLAQSQLHFTRPGTMLSGGAGGGLGYGLGMALGAQLAARDRKVICTQGDGAYMYGNPVPAHYVAMAEQLPLLTVVFNNEQWSAVKRNTRAMYPDGYAAKSNREPLTFFEPGIAYEHAVMVAGGHGERVADPAELPKALERAMTVIETEKRQALLNVVCSA